MPWNDQIECAKHREHMVKDLFRFGQVGKLKQALDQRNRSIARLKEVIAEREARIAQLIENRARAIRSLSGELVPGTSIAAKYRNYLKIFGPTVTIGTLARNTASDLIALRHDVDHDIDVALEMARIEHDLGYRATYYLLHTAPYWNTPEFFDKSLALQEYGHEVGLHVNVLSEWASGSIDDPGARLAELLASLREAGIAVSGMASHGDRLCYEIGFINYWCFAELRPDDPAADQDGRTAEGPKDPLGIRSVSYPQEHVLTRPDGAAFPLWSVSMKELGLEYDAWHLNFDRYFSDSGGSWARTPDPLEADLSAGRHQILVHPIHWSKHGK